MWKRRISTVSWKPAQHSLLPSHCFHFLSSTVWHGVASLGKTHANFFLQNPAWHPRAWWLLWFPYEASLQLHWHILRAWDCFFFSPRTGEVDLGQIPQSSSHRAAPTPVSLTHRVHLCCWPWQWLLTSWHWGKDYSSPVVFALASPTSLLSSWRCFGSHPAYPNSLIPLLAFGPPKPIVIGFAFNWELLRLRFHIFQKGSFGFLFIIFLILPYSESFLPWSSRVPLRNSSF